MIFIHLFSGDYAPELGPTETVIQGKGMANLREYTPSAVSEMTNGAGWI